MHAGECCQISHTLHPPTSLPAFQSLFLISLLSLLPAEGLDNDGFPKNQRLYPASYEQPNVIAVAASRSDDTLTNYTTFGR